MTNQNATPEGLDEQGERDPKEILEKLIKLEYVSMNSRTKWCRSGVDNDRFNV